MLGIMKAGGAYVPLDPDFPKSRLELMLADARPKVLVCHERLLERLPPVDAEVLCLDRDAERLVQASDRDPGTPPDPAHPVYVIYTSGSTGKPKGVVILHRALMNFLLSMAEETGFSQADVMGAVTTLSFDISKLELLLPLLYGARVVVATREEGRDANRLQDLLQRHKVTVLQATPATWRLLIAAGWRNPERLRVLCGGEALGQDLAAALLERTDTLWNVYGPTETTVWSAIHRVENADHPVPLGHPLANTQLYILDDRLEPAPLGVPGELFIGGAGLAKGYLNQPELTAEKFVPNPFAASPGARMYRTGDLCRRQADGRIEFLGRRDHQVKVRGFRIELGDIETALAGAPGVRQAAVTTWTGPDGLAMLAGYVVPEPDRTPDLEAIKAHLRAQLPGYMVPGVLTPLDTLPLTPNNKVDRRALPSPQSLHAQTARDYVAPRSDIEHAMAAAWGAVLGLERVGIRDNFFDLGGHSLMIVQLLARLRADCGVEVSVVDLYRHATIEALAAHLERQTPGAAPATDAPSVRVNGGSRHPCYTVRRYRAEDKEAALALLEYIWGPEQGANARALWDWKYLQNPDAPSDGPHIDILEHAGTVVGMDGGLCARLKVGTDVLPTVWSTDAVVHPEHRAATSMLVEFAMAHARGLRLGMPNAEAYAIGKPLGLMEDVLRFTDLKAFTDLGRLLRAEGRPGWAAALAGGGYGLADATLQRLHGTTNPAPSLAITEIHSADARFDAFWNATAGDYDRIIVRDAAFLNWRFFQCPTRNHTVYAAERNGQLAGYLVTRDYMKHNDKRGMIVDALVRRTDSTTLVALAARALRDARARGLSLVTFPLAPHQTGFIAALRRAGFRFHKPGVRVVRLQGPLTDRLSPDGAWHLTAADSDMDLA